MYLEKRDFGIWYELVQNKMRFFIKGCDENKNQSPAFLMIYVAPSLTHGGVTFNDGY